MNVDGVIVQTRRQLTQEEMGQRETWKIGVLGRIEEDRGLNLDGPPYFIGHRVTGTIWDFFILPLLDRIRELEGSLSLAQTVTTDTTDTGRDVTGLRIGDRVRVISKPSVETMPFDDWSRLITFNVSRGITAGITGTVEDVDTDIVDTTYILVRLNDWHQGHWGEGRGKDEYWFFFPEQLEKI